MIASDEAAGTTGAHPEAPLALWPEEAKVWAQVQPISRELAAAFRQHLPQARAAIMRRLLVAVVRENLLGLGAQARWADDGRTLILPLPGVGEVRAPINERQALGRFVPGPKLCLLRGERPAPL
ncbi:MAG: hypothetical protein NZ700_01020, partial [Gemmataceae bacterium]|nr:hypothetical protein [Gemmataceae bacterium]